MGEDESEEVESRDWVISETEFGAMGEKTKIHAQVESERIQRERTEIDTRLRELERLDSTSSDRLGDLDSDNPNENVYHLLILRRRAEGSVREACREESSSSSMTANPIGSIGLESMWRRNKDEESKPVPTSKPVPDKSGGKKTGKEDK